MTLPYDQNKVSNSRQDLEVLFCSFHFGRTYPKTVNYGKDFLIYCEF